MRILCAVVLGLSFTAMMLAQQTQKLVLAQEEPRREASPPPQEPQPETRPEGNEPQETPQEKQEKPEKQEKQEKHKDKDKDKDKASKGEERQNGGQANGEAGQMHRAGGNGGHIPDDKFRAKFGRGHTFKVSKPVVVNNQPTFTYSGYTFVMVDPWPVGWAYTDDCYIDYVDGDYLLFDLLHPGVSIALFVQL
jgi:hypothetical protein